VDDIGFTHKYFVIYSMFVLGIESILYRFRNYFEPLKMIIAQLRQQMAENMSIAGGGGGVLEKKYF